MYEERIADLLENLPESADLPDLTQVFRQAERVPRPDWDLPILSCLSVGGQEEDGIIGSAAVACLQISIILVDDMLDDDPRGEYHRRGSGPTANLALAFQSASFRLLDSSNLDPITKSDACSCLAHIALATAVGQSLDTKNLTGEENYWRVIKAKSTPFYGGALQLGGILGKSTPDIRDSLYSLGVTIGEIIQIEDDLQDAFEDPANPDWLEGRNNLLMLYALSAPHTDQNRFSSLRNNINNSASLKEAQSILISSGALSYAAYHLIDRYKQATALLVSMNLAEPQPLQVVLDDYAKSLTDFLSEIGLDIPGKFLNE